MAMEARLLLGAVLGWKLWALVACSGSSKAKRSQRSGKGRRMATTAADAAECVRLQAELVKATGLLAAARAAAYQAEVQLQSTHAYAAAAAQEARTLAAENARLQAHVEAADRQLRQLSAALSRQQQQVLPQEERQGQQRRQEGAWRQPVAASRGQRLPPPQQHQHEAAGSTADLAQVVEQLRRELAEVRGQLAAAQAESGELGERLLEAAFDSLSPVTPAAHGSLALASPRGGTPLSQDAALRRLLSASGSSGSGSVQKELFPFETATSEQPEPQHHTLHDSALARLAGEVSSGKHSRDSVLQSGGVSGCSALSTAAQQARQQQAAQQQPGLEAAAATIASASWRKQGP
ncbi:hypothetical protein D9Q98_009464 [Chlorella vulgaris]|uniref:Uncharacterized protein n=1 Tax=Chlorella vulgaris TaxID=3077 RepID=A0A9D4YSJ5_CHLVU|nr:hypothetical protein D9Q98_009464 [Chlorella vulgaris]